MELPKINVPEEIKRAAVMVAYQIVGGNVTDAVQRGLTDLSGAKRNAKGELVDPTTVTKLLDSGPGRAGVAYILGVGSEFLVPRAPNDRFKGMLGKMGNVLRVGAFAQLATSALHATIDPIIGGIKDTINERKNKKSNQS